MLSRQNLTKEASDEGRRCKFFTASMAHFSSLAFTLAKKGGAVPCQLTLHGMTCIYTGKKAVPCWPTYFASVNMA